MEKNIGELIIKPIDDDTIIKLEVTDSELQLENPPENKKAIKMRPHKADGNFTITTIQIRSEK